MKKDNLKKTLKLSLEFDTYLTKHPSLYKKIPNGASVFITVKGDEKFNRSSVRNVADVKGKIIEARKEGRRWTLSPLVAVH